MNRRSHILATTLAILPSVAFADAMDGGSAWEWFVIGLVIMLVRFRWILLLSFVIGLTVVTSIQYRSGKRGVSLFGRSTAFAVLGLLGGYCAVYTSWFVWCMFARM